MYMKSKIIVVLLSLLSIQSASAQLDLSKLKIQYETIASDSSIISEAVAPALTIIRQQYRLERGGKYYGKNKRPFYGETYTLGVKVSGGTIMQRGVVIPWENDAAFHRVKQGGKYKPAIYWSLQKSLSDSIWKTVELELGTQYVSPIDKDSLLFRHADAMSDFGLPTDETSGPKKGYMVWAYTNSEVNDSTMQVSLRQVSHSVEDSTDSIYYSVSPKDADKVIGGIFVIPSIERVGYIKLQMAGVAVKNKEGKWVLCLLTKKTDGNVKTEEVEKKDKKQRKKKDEPKSKQEEVVDEFEPTPIK